MVVKHRSSSRRRNESSKPDPDEGEMVETRAGISGSAKGKPSMWRPKATPRRVTREVVASIDATTMGVDSPGMRKYNRKSKKKDHHSEGRYEPTRKHRSKYDDQRKGTRDSSDEKPIPIVVKPDTVFDMFWSMVLDDDGFSDSGKEYDDGDSSSGHGTPAVARRGRDPRRRPVPPPPEMHSSKEKRPSRSSKHTIDKKKKTSKKKKNPIVDTEVMEYFLGDGNAHGSETETDVVEPKRQNRRKNKQGSSNLPPKNGKSRSTTADGGNSMKAIPTKKKNSNIVKNCSSDSDSLTDAPKSGCRMFGINTNPGVKTSSSSYNGCSSTQNPFRMATQCYEQTEAEFKAAADKIKQFRRKKHVSAADIEMDDIQERPAEDKSKVWWKSGPNLGSLTRNNKMELEKWWNGGSALPMCPMPPKFDPNVTLPQNEPNSTTTRDEYFRYVTDIAQRSPEDSPKAPSQEDEKRDPPAEIRAENGPELTLQDKKEESSQGHGVKVITISEENNGEVIVLKSILFVRAIVKYSE